MNEERDPYIQIEVGGKDENMWKRLRPKLLDAINTFLEAAMDNENEIDLRQEAKKFASALYEYRKDRFNSDDFEKDKIAAEIELMHSKKEMNYAQAQSIRFKTTLDKLIIAMAGTKVILIGSRNEEELIFLKQIDEFLFVLKDIQDRRRSFPS